LLHGQAHGAEMPAGANGWLVALGFVAGTAVLHGSGIGAGCVLQQIATHRSVRAAGGAIVILAALLGLDVF
jgi:urease accessory protein